MVKFKKFALDDELISQFIAGVSSVKIHQKLINDAVDEFSKCVDIAINIEMTESETRQFTGSSSVSSIVVKPNNQCNKKSFPACNSCARFYYESRCPAIDWECYVCNKKVHTSRVCSNNRSQSRGRSNVRTNQQSQHRSQSQNQRISRSQISSHYRNVNTIGNIGGSSPLTVELLVEDKSILFDIDSGACTIVEYSISEYVRNFSQLPPSKEKLFSVTGKSIVVHGEIEVHVKDVILTLTIIESERSQNSLLGRDWLDVIFPNRRNPFMPTERGLNSVSLSPLLCHIKEN